MKSPLYQTVPKGIADNLEFRARLLDEASRSVAFQRSLWTACARDLLFYVNTFVFTHDPRRTGSRDSTVVPFVTWEYQDEALLTIQECVSGGRDLVIQKSRDMGASWLCLVCFEWFWHFRGQVDFLLVSRKEDYVDAKEDPKSLFWKLDFVLKRQPGWLKPKMDRAYMRLVNVDSGATFTGESTNKDVARGSRQTAILLDEFASVREGFSVLASITSATDCRIFNSTPAGSANAFYDMVKNPEVKKLTLHWSKHPHKSRGLYYGADGKPRSPWYDREVLRAAHRMQVAQELDIDYLGASYQWFDDTAIDGILAEVCRRPLDRGSLGVTEQGHPTSFSSSENGPLLLWINVDPASGRPPRDRNYGIGCDIAAGSRDASGRGASNSVASVLDLRTNEKVAEFAVNGVSPEDFATQVVGLARWFGGLRSEADGPDGAFLIWEGNGPGRAFGQQVMALNYRYVFHHHDTRKAIYQRSDIPGFYTSLASKQALLSQYRTQLQSRKFLNYSADAVGECRQYVYTPNGVTHARALSTPDPTGARENHGDRVMADALACKILVDRPHEDVTMEQVRPFTYAARMAEALAAGRKKDDFWSF